MEKICPICKKRISDWEAPKTVHIDDLTVHGSCVLQFKERTGKDWTKWEISEELFGGGEKYSG